MSGDVAVLSDALWKNRFGARTDISGAAVRVDDRPVTIVGVMPASFLGVTDTSEIWLPISRFTSAGALQNRGNRWHGVVARLPDATTIEQAQAEMNGIAVELARDFPDTNADSGVDPMVALRSD